MLDRIRFLLVCGILPSVVLVFVLVSLANPVNVRAAVLTVGIDCATLQDCIDNAVGGDTIQVPAGSYATHVFVDKPLTINGASAQSTRLDGSSSNRVISVSLGIPITLTNLTIQNGNVADQGGGLSASARVVLENVDLIQNQSTVSGGGIWTDGDLSATNVRVEMNHCLGPSCDGGGIFAAGATLITGTSIISGNVADGSGGGVYAYAGVRAHNITITNNVSQESGGGLWANGALTLTNATVISNYSQFNGGGIHANGSGWVDLGSFERNVADFAGGGLSIGNDLAVTASDFTANQAASTGGAISTQGDITLSDSLITGNISMGSGGGLIAANGLVVSSTFTLNEATMTGGGALINGNGVISNSHFMSNVAHSRGGGYYGTNLESFATQFISNTAGSGGGGIYIDGELDLDSSQVISNQAGFAGGGIRAATAVISGSDFLENRCDGDPCVGGGLYSLLDLSLYGSTFIANSSRGIAGGVYIVGGSQISATYFLQNLADISGGATFHDISSSGNYENVIFADNQALSGGATIYLQTSGQVYLNHVTMVGRPGSLREGIWVNLGTLTVVNSIITQFQTGLHNQDVALAENNIFYENQANVFGMSFDPSNHIENPDFVDIANRDYHLAFRSFAIDIAAPTSLTVDFEGNARPNANASDVGAYESTFTRDQIDVAGNIASTQFLPNQPFTYTIQYENVGMLPADNLVLTNTIPAELTAVTFTSNRTITATGTVTYEWDLGDLPVAELGIITVTGKVIPDLMTSQVLINTLQLRTDNSDVVATFPLNVQVPVIEFSSATGVILETEGSITVDVVLSPANPYQNSTVTFSTMDGTALAGQDYVATGGELTLIPGATTDTIQVEILHNILAEAPETFFIALSNSMGANLGPNEIIEITIEDTDTGVYLPIVTNP